MQTYLDQLAAKANAKPEPEPFHIPTPGVDLAMPGGRLPSKTQVGRFVEAISQRGISDPAAARAFCVSATTMARWKKEDPDLAAVLLRAREEFRKTQLAIIANAAARSPNGWRAAIWLLERSLPEDYSRSPDDRATIRRQAERDQEKLERDLQQEAARERLERSYRSETQTAPRPTAPSPAPLAHVAPAPIPVSQNSQNSRPDPVTLPETKTPNPTTPSASLPKIPETPTTLVPFPSPQIPTPPIPTTDIAPHPSPSFP